MINVVMSTIGTGGDVFPFVTMGRMLSARGHRVTLVTNACYEEAVRSADLLFEPIDSEEQARQMIRDGAAMASGHGLLTFVHRHVRPGIAREADAIRRHVVPGRTVLMTRSTPALAARIVADEQSLPLIGVLMAPANAAGRSLYVDIVTNALTDAVNDCRRRAGLSDVENWREWLSFETSIGLWPQWYGGIHSSWPGTLRLIGFVLAEHAVAHDSNASLPSLPSGRPLALVTAGTGFFGGAGFFKTAIHGCCLAGCHAIVVCSQQELLPATLPDGCVAVPSVRSLAALMRRVAIVCHHGGMGTLGQALAAGIPQLVMAAGGDRPDNAERLTRLGVASAISLRERTPERVGAALRAVLDSGAVRLRCSELAVRCNEVPTADLLVGCVEAAAAGAARSAATNALVSSASDLLDQIVPTVSR